MADDNNNNNDASQSQQPHRSIQCHYDVLGVEQTADAATIKKAHRKLALKLHPDKNVGNHAATTEQQFRLVQQAYETLSDPMERKWYDDHRDAILRGWSAQDGDGGGDDMLFDVVPYTYSGCFSGFGNDDQGFYAVYRSVFAKIYQGEHEGTRVDGSSSALDYLSTDFGTAESDWADVSAFYQGWESFASGLNFAWADQYDIKDAPNRRVRRAMEDENKKARRTAKRARNDDVLALVRFVKKRDPRVQSKLAQLEAEREQKEEQRKLEAAERKRQAQQAREDWKVEAEKNMAQREEEDRLAGRFRLADLEDDYDYGGGKKKKGKRKKGKKKSFQEDEEEDNIGENEDEGGEPDVAPGSEDATTNQKTDESDASAHEEEKKAREEEDTLEETLKNNAGNQETLEASEEQSQEIDEDYDESSSEEEEPDVWRCECCRKDFKSEAQMENHFKSKKHKETYKKYQKKMEQQAVDKQMLS